MKHLNNNVSQSVNTMLAADTLHMLKNQHPTAIETLYDTYGAALYGVVMNIVRSEDIAQHVLQDTFVKAWRNGSSYDTSKGRIFTWLLNIARNTAIDVLRSAQYRKSNKTDGIDLLRHAHSNDAINQDTIGLREMVQKMDEKYKILIDLVYFNGYTQEEASKETGVPVSTVKTRLRYAISALKKAYTDAQYN